MENKNEFKNELLAEKIRILSIFNGLSEAAQEAMQARLDQIDEQLRNAK